MDRFEAMSAFVAVVEAGSFTAASRKLGMPLATLSRKVSELEDQLRVQLLTRSTRHIALTEPGQQFFATSRRLIEELGEAERLASGEYQAPKGELVVSAPIVFGRLYLTPIVVEFLKAYPDIHVDLKLSDRVVNLLADHIDVGLKIGDLSDSGSIALKTGVVRRVVCASPAYIGAKGAALHPRDLAAHDCITFTAFDMANEWTFAKGKRIEKYPVRSRLSVSTAEAAADAAIAGLGVTRLLCYQVSKAIADGRLKLLMRDYEPTPLPVQLVYPSGRLVPQKLRAFLDFVAPRLKEKLALDPQ